MDSSLVVGINRIAEIYNRPAFNPPAARLYQMATGIEDEQQFFLKLFELCKTCRAFPLPADFAQAALPCAQQQGESAGSSS